MGRPLRTACSASSSVIPDTSARPNSAVSRQKIVNCGRVAVDFTLRAAAAPPLPELHQPASAGSWKGRSARRGRRTRVRMETPCLHASPSSPGINGARA